MFQVYLSRVCFILALKCWRKDWSQCQIKQVQKNKWRTRQKVRTFKILIRNLRCCTSARQWLECICSCRYIADFGRKEKEKKKKRCLWKVFGLTGEQLQMWFFLDFYICAGKVRNVTYQLYFLGYWSCFCTILTSFI